MTESKELLTPSRPIVVYLTKIGARRICNRFDLPKDEGQMLEALRRDYKEGYLGIDHGNPHGNHGRDYILSFIRPPALYSTILRQEEGDYFQVSARRGKLHILDGTEKVMIVWRYGKGVLESNPLTTKTYKPGSTKRNNEKKKIHNRVRQNKEKRRSNSWGEDSFFG
jgi:hypothetical protein